jgi:predicted GNAT family acetyltransferase
LPEYRGKGYAGALVTDLAVKMTSKSKRTELLCARDSIIEFYKHIGFEKTGEWALV